MVVVAAVRVAVAMVAVVAVVVAAVVVADAAGAGRTRFASGLPLELVSIWQITQ